MENPVLKFKNLPVSIFQVLELNTYTTTTQKSLLMLRVLNCVMFRIKLSITLNINLPQFMALFSQVSLYYSSDRQAKMKMKKTLVPHLLRRKYMQLITAVSRIICVSCELLSSIVVSHVTIYAKPTKMSIAGSIYIFVNK